MTNKVILKKNRDTDVLELIKQDSNLILTRQEAGLYVLNGFEVDTYDKLFAVSDTTKNTKITINDVDAEIIIECRLDGVLIDNIDYVYLLIDVLNETEYTDEELSTILFAQSVLVKKGLISEASKIGAPRPR